MSLGLFVLAGASLVAVAASAGLFVAADRWRPALGLVGWVPAAAATPVAALVGVGALLTVAAVVSGAWAFWPLRVESLLPVAIGAGLAVAAVPVRTGAIVLASDVGVGFQALLLVVGGVAGYAILARAPRPGPGG